MAKDGTNRGGARPGAGRKPKALAEKLAAGNPGHRPLTMMDPGNMVGVDMPPPAAALQDGYSVRKQSVSSASSENIRLPKHRYRVLLCL